ncbi:MAG: hypothetical protein K0M70_15610 [Arenimonas sp.]|uniref:hypothetical protein n=1 Tax=Arenimonas sp. TaxID=1872635 RepID=UPI0025BFDB28|nr:hypothetical protein [Arenimonas sp.]MBW8369270.1 hypothetical protein [Arenimonas sp.]
MSWNPQQQAMLSAMGYTLYRQAGAAPEADAVPPQAAVPARASDRLLQALVRAAGGRDLAALGLPPMEQLRASGAAKRALWPRLRALRRSR